MKNKNITTQIQNINKMIIEKVWETKRLEYEMNHVETEESKRIFDYYVLECGCEESSIGSPNYIRNKEINKNTRMKVASELKLLKQEIKKLHRQL
jgi:hypothetical protein